MDFSSRTQFLEFKISNFTLILRIIILMRTSAYLKFHKNAHKNKIVMIIII